MMFDRAHAGQAKGHRWQFDAKGVELCRTCSKCHTAQMKKHRPEILSGYTHEDIDEQIEEDE